ncbi:metallophosphoesterase [Pseudothermotoga sp.]|uniref:metallophosphoesterase family protein n=1 Tax=Pseudothermotoga sp. TaxID=2033661 RepID=UPI0031F631BB
MKRSLFVLFLFVTTLLATPTKILVGEGWKVVGETSLVEKPSVPFTMIVYGDSRWGHRVHRKLVEMMIQHTPSIVVHLGDMVNSGDNHEDWQIFFEITAPLREIAFFQPVKGNHEKPDVYYKRYFGVYNYWAKVGNYVLIFLDPDVGIEECRKFLRSIDLSRKVPIVFIHYPIFSAGPHGSTETVKRLQVLHETFSQLGVSLVFSSHDHNYQRLIKDGIIYVVSGGGGAPLYRVGSVEGLVKGIVVHHFVKLRFEEDRIECEAISIDGKVIDSFTIFVRNVF